MSQSLLVIDGTALAFRAFFAMPDLSDDQGRPSGALHGFLGSLNRVISELPADLIVVAWDRPEPTFRHKMDPQYKANRDELDDDLRVQFPWMREMVDLLGLPSLDRVGFEADDVMATLAVQGEKAGLEVYLCSSDKDLAQVVTNKVWQCPPGKGAEPARKLGPKDIQEKFGVPPKSMKDWQALVGDSSDNIPGVKGVGPKRATGLLEKYGDLDTILAEGPQQEKGKLAENLAEFASEARRSLELVTLITDLDLGDILQLKPSPRNEDLLREFFKQHGLRSHLAKLGLADEEESQDTVSGSSGSRAGSATTPSSSPSPVGGLFADQKPAQSNRNYHLVENKADLSKLIKKLKAAKGFTFDTETTSVNPQRAKLVGMSFAIKPGEAWYVPVQLKGAVEMLRPLLEDPKLGKRGQNLKYDHHVMRHHGVIMQGIDFDTMLAHFLIAPNERHNLDDLSMAYLQIEKIPTKTLLGTGKNALTMDQVPVSEVCEYACEDADCTLQLIEPMQKQLEEVQAQKLYFEIELPLLEVLARMEAEGIRVDPVRLREMAVHMQKRQAELEELVHHSAGTPFNLNSPKQLGPILFEKLCIQNEAGIKKVGRTKTGYKTDAATLEKYLGIPIVDDLLEYRRLSKLLSTYVVALPNRIHPETGRIHTSFNQAVAATGRLSSSDPNLQNIPIRSEDGRAIRRAFVPRAEGWEFLAADYSQVELRLVAHLSQDPALIAAFKEDADIHARTAALIFGLTQEEVTSDLRSRAKAINFGILYGMGPQRLAQETGVSFSEARQFIQQYFDALPGVRAWLDQTIEQAKKTGEVRTLLGRRRPVPELQSADRRVRSNAENVAVNSPVQGSAADIIKIAMLRLDQRLQKEGLQAKMILQVHDELVFDVPKDEKERVEAIVREEMENAYPLDVPLKVDIGWGMDWAEAH